MDNNKIQVFYMDRIFDYTKTVREKYGYVYRKGREE